MLDIKTYFESYSSQTVWYWYENRQKDQKRKVQKQNQMYTGFIMW